MKKFFLLLMISTIMFACSKNDKTGDDSFDYIVDQFADMQILRYQVRGIEQLSTKQKELLYYLTEAALQGRDILYDQNCKYNLAVRRTCEAVYEHCQLDRNSDEFNAFEVYLKRIWVSNGIHHHYSGDKFKPEFSEDFLRNAIEKVDAEYLPLNRDESKAEFCTRLFPVIFDPAILAKRTNQEAGVDLIETSAGNYYENVTQAEAEAFYDAMKKMDEKNPISYGLNSKLIKENGLIVEKKYRIGSLYSSALENVVFWLQKAASVAENDKQKAVIEKLIEFNQIGDLKTFDEYAILWVNDTDSHIDFINGFTETYGDPLGMKASWESLVNFKNNEATKRTEIISKHAQWFEQHSPTAKEFKKDNIKGVTAKVITAAILGGDCYPTTPIGINLPNSNWIRAAYGSKSVTIENITEAYDKASQGNGLIEEFAWSEIELDLIKKYAFQTDNLHTDLHECLGHGSGKLLPGVDQDALKSYGAVIEETRADLFGLYFMADPIMVESGLLPNIDAYKAQYYKYFMNGLMTQLTRIEPGKNLEESHMRNRQLITRYVLDAAVDDHCVEIKKRDGKTYVVVNDYKKIQQHLGELLAEVQRIKSTGDYDSAQKLVETYAVKIDSCLHNEILSRYAKLNTVPYKGFVNPKYTPIYDKTGVFIDLNVDYTENYAEQHLRYSKNYSTLPSWN